jgi:amino acid adenylation domain-containing protein
MVRDVWRAHRVRRALGEAVTPVNAASLVESLESVGIQLWLEGSQLRFRAPHGALSSEQRRELAAAREEVLAFLRQRESSSCAEVPLSYGQRSLWLVHQDLPQSAAYNVAFAVNVMSTVNTAHLREALQALCDRHAVLRTTYPLRDGRPVQRIDGFAQVVLDERDCTGADDAELCARVQADYRRPFDLLAGPVWRTSLFTRSPSDHVLLICAHHIAVDGWSLLLLLDELRQLLAGLAAGQVPALRRPEPSYAEYTAWQSKMLAGPDGESLAAYWEQQLRAPRVELELPADRPRPPRKADRGATHAFTVPPELLRQLRALARAEGSTLFVLMLAAFKVLLMRYSRTEDVVVGTPTLGRDKGRFDRCVGHFVNVVPLRTAVSATVSFRELLGRVRQTLVAAIDAQEYPLALMVERLRPERNPSRSPLFETLFVLQRFEQFGALSSLLNAGGGACNSDFGGLAVRPYALAQQEGQFDLSLGLVEIDDCLAGGFKFATDLFDETTISRMARAYITLLRSVVANPDAVVNSLRLLDDAERRALIRPAERPNRGAGRTMHERFEAQVAQRPESIALRWMECSISYVELNQRANRLAHALRRYGVAPGTRIGLCMDRTPDLVVGLLGILKAGAAYVPIDLSQPLERVQFMLDDADVPLLVTHSGLQAHRPIFAGTAIEIDDPVLREMPTDNPAPAAGTDDLMYVIYTSGSTGQPKGTLITHRAVDRLLDATHAWFGFDDHDVWTLFHSVAFDFSVWELWGALAYGGTLVIVPYLVSRAPEEVLALIRSEKVTVLNQTPSAFRQLIQADIESGTSRPTTLRTVIFGGEALELQSLRPWFERHGEATPRLVNMYGITETCVHVTYRPIRLADVEAGRGSLIGVPIPDLRLYVLESGGEPAPVGVIGEIHVGGPGLALGYLNRPELTAERFVSDPFVPGERLYRSGDLARRTADGDIEYVGRGDQQVKMRGYRIELAEIEAALSRQPDVRQAVVIVHESPSSGLQLVAYVVAIGVDENALRNALRATLPEYMVPSVFVLLDTLPLTGNNKVDVRALPPPDTSRRTVADAPAPRTPLEVRLLSLWRQVLQRDDLGIADSFFDHGGHSLLAVELLSRVREITGRRLPFATLFSAPTVMQMAALVEEMPIASTDTSDDPVPALLQRLGSLGVGLSVEGDRLKLNAPKGVIDDELRTLIGTHKAAMLAAIAADGACAVQLSGAAPVKVPRNRPRPASHMQRRLWFLKQLDPGNAAYNLPCAFRFEGDLDEALLERCLADLVARHESLRTRFVVIDGAPHALIEQAATIPFERVDVSSHSVAERETEAARLLEAFTSRVFDLAQAPLLRALLVRLAPSTVVFCLVIDHIVADGLSLGVLLAELRTLYTARREGRDAVLPPLAMQYVDLVVWQDEVFARGALAEHKRFWMKELADLPALLPLPTDRTRPPVQTYRGAHLVQPLAHELVRRVRAAARQASATTFIVLLAAFQALLRRHTSLDDIPVGTAVGNRAHPDSAGVVGFFANNIVLRGNLSGNPTVTEHIARVREMCLRSMAHQEIPFDMLVDELATRRETDHSPLFQVLFVLQNWASPIIELPGAHGEVVVLRGQTARYDLSVDIFEVGDRMAAFWEYNTDLFDAATIERLMAQYERLLDDMLARPDARLDDLRLLCDEDQRQVLLEWNDTAGPQPLAQTVHALFEAQVRRTPDAEALVFESQSLSYRELNGRANRLAHRLRTLGVGRESLVGVWLDRSVEMMVAVLAVLKAGGAYVPLDPAFPQDRIDYMMTDAQLAAVITQDRFAKTLGDGAPCTVCMDGDANFLAQHPYDDPVPLSGPADLAYVIYTSGSTGRPKGVMVEHRSVVNFLVSMQREPGIQASDRFVAVTTLSFDIAGLELYGPLTCGGTVVLATRKAALDGRALAALLEGSRASLLQATPATWRLLLDSGWRGLPGLKMLCGGEALPRELAERLLALPGELWNLYGPTETTIWSTVTRVVDVTRPITIGRPIANTQIYVLEPSGQPAPVGVGGELCIGGDGLARGYLNRDELTAEKFAHIELPGIGRTRVYRTGDIVRWRADGHLEFIGRRDHQVKVRGFRIELGEIETVLARHPGVNENVVLVREDTLGDQRLVAYVVCAEGVPFDSESARATLREKLPEYMLPNHFVALDALPLTPNGKVDRNALPAPVTAVDAPDDGSAALMSPDEQRVADAWREVLGAQRIGLRDNFFDLGGHSLLLVKLQARLQCEFSTELPLVELFQRTTVQAQALRLKSVTTADSGALQRARTRAEKQANA